MSAPFSRTGAEIMVVSESDLTLNLVAGLLKQIRCRPRLVREPALASAELVRSRPDAILLDEAATRPGGTPLIPRLRDQGEAGLPILVLTGANPREARRAALEAGATDVLSKPPDILELRARLGPLIELALARRQLSEQEANFGAEVQAAVARTVAREREIIRRLALAAEHRDEQAGDHLSRVAGCAIAIAEALGLPEDEVDDIALASTMHDVGKIAVPDHILLKAGPLDEAELREMREHTIRGFRILDGSSSRLIDLAAQIALTHHERWDGTGYPRGLKGEEIPLPGRITAVADVFDALVSARPYKPAWPLDEARAFLEKEAGRHFDPLCVRAFLSRWPDIVELVGSKGPKPAA